MVEKLLRTEIHDMSNKIYELQEKTEHLTNGQRYAAINEIEKLIQPLRNDLRNLEHQLYTQQSNDESIQKDINQVVKQIDELENIKSDLTQRINTETEHMRKEFNTNIIKFMSEELSPIKEDIANNKQEIISIKEDISTLRVDIRDEFASIKKDEAEYRHAQEIEQAKRFDKFKVLITIVLSVISAISAISLWLEPAIRTLAQVFL